jgi:glycosyltransferase involved in cell wall biosynthesis
VERVVTTQQTQRERFVCPSFARPVAGVRQPSSLGIVRYCDRLAHALHEVGADYQLTDGPIPGRETHFHLANSSRRAILQAPRTSRFVVTVHDVRPRTDALLPLYRAVVYPGVVGRAETVIVHSHFAAGMLYRLGVAPRRLEVIPHPAPRPSSLDRARARKHLALEEGRLVAVLPGVIKRAKLVYEAIAGASKVRDDWLLILAGPIRDRRAAREARAAGALVIEAPDDVRYEQLIVAADAVLCLRAASVGETNGPLLDALGAGRAVLATPTGSIPETAGEAAHYVGHSAASVADGLRALTDQSERQERERTAMARSAGFSWNASAQAHLRLFAEVFDD